MRAELPIDLLRRCGRSFYWGSHFLPAAQRLAAARLYAVCRRLDDIADDLPPDQAEAELAAIHQALTRGNTSCDEAAEFLALEREHGVPHLAAARLVTALRADCRPRCFSQPAQVLRYAYGVAGSVGLMMSPLLGVRAPRAAAPFAVDLGVAMQLTNIARDLLEDAQRGRRYLPLGDSDATPDCSPEALLADAPGSRALAWPAVLKLLSVADRYYRSAEQGMSHIPPRQRLAIAIAGRVYEGIGTEIKRLGPQRYWCGRARVTAFGKLALTARVVGLAMLGQGPGASHALPSHQAELHQAFADLLAADLGETPGLKDVQS